MGDGMDQETIRRKQGALRTILNLMDVPELRKDVTVGANLRWLLRNLAANNGKHPMFDTAHTLLKQLYREARK